MLMEATSQLKADYIPGYGDCVDLVLLGAGWDKERARELLGALVLHLLVEVDLQHIQWDLPHTRRSTLVLLPILRRWKPT